MKNFKLHFKFLFFIITSLIFTNISYSQWTIVGDLAGVSDRPTLSVVDFNTAFVTGGSSVNATYKTTNGGVNWIQLNTGSNDNFRSWNI